MRVLSFFKQKFSEPKSNNSITSILVYKHTWPGTNQEIGIRTGFFNWVFDDPKVGLDKEAFVAGADSLLDIISQGKDQVLVNFSSKEFPGYKLKLDYVSGNKTEGAHYYCKELNQPLWLCPAHGLYFSKSPKNIYLDYKV